MTGFIDIASFDIQEFQSTLWYVSLMYFYMNIYIHTHINHTHICTTISTSSLNELIVVCMLFLVKNNYLADISERCIFS